MDSPDEVERMITEWRAGVAEQAERFDAARRAIDEVSVTETAAGGAIVLTVASSGIPTDLRLGDGVDRMKPDQVAAQIMACLRRAQTRLADRVGSVVVDTIGDAAGGQAIAEEYRHRFPPLPGEDDHRPPLVENADFGLSDLAPDPTPPATVPAAAPVRATRRTPADDDEDWDAPLW
ncbi:hypothetical protein ACFXGA_09550 [Actinosynnema sp. NPDC059335]|uniref:hypothetical protein n=1 Tax=Actinosynnema sp. NPDC059335 TaxID=3346804 RepID=UPI0036712FED